jgi:phosphatidylserine synthase
MAAGDGRNETLRVVIALCAVTTRTRMAEGRTFHMKLPFNCFLGTPAPNTSSLVLTMSFHCLEEGTVRKSSMFLALVGKLVCFDCC